MISMFKLPIKQPFHFLNASIPLGPDNAQTSYNGIHLSFTGDFICKKHTSSAQMDL